jgi:hypothetical protein
MRLVVMHKNDPHTEAGEPPPPSLIADMGALIMEYAQSGRFLGGEGLRGSSTRTRLTFRDGACSVEHGPYAGEHELPSTILVLRVATRDEAIGWAERYGKILGHGELELGPVNEPWDIGVMPRPENPPLRFLLIEKAGRAGDAPRSAQHKAALTRLRTEMRKAGVLQSVEELEPSAKAKRLVFTKNVMHVIDGPFSESKELIGGFAIMRLSGIDEAIAMSQRYAAILGGTLEIDIRPALEPDEIG